MSPPLDRVDVHIVMSDTTNDERLVAASLDVLTDKEHSRSERFIQPADRTRFVIGRWLARTMLSQYVDVAPREWPFVIDEYGRPHLARHPAVAPDLRFNLSHTHGLVACAVTVGREVGVDVEHTARQLLHDVPERFFSAREIDDLRARPESEQHSAFFDYWTLKESYIKARGLGLTLPLRQFSFLLDGSDAPAVVFALELNDDPRSWQFRMFQPSADHRLAVAVRRRGADLPIVVRHVRER